MTNAFDAVMKNLQSFFIFAILGAVLYPIFGFGFKLIAITVIGLILLYFLVSKNKISRTMAFSAGTGFVLGAAIIKLLSGIVVGVFVLGLILVFLLPLIKNKGNQKSIEKL